MKTLAQQLEGNALVEDANDSLSREGLPDYCELVALLEQVRVQEHDPECDAPVWREIHQALHKIRVSLAGGRKVGEV